MSLIGDSGTKRYGTGSGHIRSATDAVWDTTWLSAFPRSAGSFEQYREAAWLAVSWWRQPSLFVFRNAVMLSLLFGAAMTLLPPAVLGWRYDTNDDVFLRFIAEGFFSDDPKLNAFLIFSNVQLGYFLQFLYQRFPSIFWYDGLQTASVFVASAVSFYSVARGSPSRILTIVITICLSASLLSISVRHQFTLVAAVLAGAGFCLLLSAIASPPRTTFRAATILVLGTVCVIIGSLMRFDSFVLSFLASLAGFGYCVLHRLRKSSLAPLVTIAACAIVAVAFYQTDKSTYRLDSEWSGFWQHNSARTNVTEYLPSEDGWIPRPLVRRMEASGLSFNDRELLSNFFFSNSSIFGTDQLAAADRATSAERRSVPLLAQAIVATLRQIISDWPLYALAFLSIGLAGLSRRSIALSTAFCLYAFLLAAALALLFKPIPFRVSHGLFYVAALAAWIAIVSDRPLEPRQRKLRAGDNALRPHCFGVASVLLALAFVGLSLLYNRRQTLISSTVSTAVLADIERIKSPRIVVMGGWLPYEHVVQPFARADAISRTRFQLTGWIDQTPFQQRLLARRGIKDLLLSTCQDDGARLVASQSMLPLLQRYMGEHFSVFPNFSREPGNSALQVFKCSLEPPSLRQ